MASLPNYTNFLSATLSAEGLGKLREKAKERTYPGQHSVWTDDYRVELPVRIGREGIASIPATTAVDEWQEALPKFGKHPALSVKREGKWVTLKYDEYYEKCLEFARALLASGNPQFTVVNLIGFNSPEWVIAYFGSIFARCLPVGIYATNSETACHYIANHSEARIVVAENNEYAKKYFTLLGKGIDRIVIYGQTPKDPHGGRVVSWSDFMLLGKGEKHAPELSLRMKRIQPGNCSTLIYTSGTTGMPKGVMISHDSFIFCCKSTFQRVKNRTFKRMVSYLPLSHSAGQFIDIYMALLMGSHVFFAEPTALTGTLIQTLQEVRPEAFFSVPRIWEKMYEKMMEVTNGGSRISAKIVTWAKSVGEEGTLQEEREQPTSFQFKLAKYLVFNRVKKALGLDQCSFFIFGSAPLDPAIRKSFFAFNIFLRNGYGMTESTAPECNTEPGVLSLQRQEDYLEVGTATPGTEMKIYGAKGEEEGEICMRGRNICMGYLKNPEETAKTIDPQGFLHSGDLGRIKNGALFITGRVKELIITAGGQNVPPILIQNEIKTALPCLSNAMVVGDYRKFLTCLISLKQNPPQSGNLDKSAQQFLASRGCAIKTIKEAINNSFFRKIVHQGLTAANTKAISRAQKVQDFHLMTEDFSVENGTLTTSLKVRRKEVMKRYEAEIEAMYNTPKL